MTASKWPAGSDGTPGAAMAACLQAAIAAPSIHNSQPWLFRLHGAGVDVLADANRRLDVADPDGREMYESVAAALFNLRVAMLARGRQPMVRILPDPAEPNLVATVTVGPAIEPDEDTVALADAIPRRRTNRRPFGSTPVPHPARVALVGAALAEGVSLVLVEDDARRQVLDIVRRAEERQRADARYRAELARWTASTPGRRDGVPPEAFGPRPQLAALPVRDFDPDRGYRRRVARFEGEPTFAILYTPADTRADWVSAGQALERVLLTATVRGLAAAPLTQAMEVADLRQLFGPARDAGVAQSLLRLGYASGTRPTPRRPLSDVLIWAGD